MNALNRVLPSLMRRRPLSAATHPYALPWSDTRFIADWTEMSFVHFTVPPETLARNTPFAPDIRNGRAFVSLVFFRFGRVRPPGSGWAGRMLFRPVSEHFFLNFRAYVRGPAGPGIEFLAEWIPNPISMVLGPLFYGLPYRRGDFHWTRDPADTHGHLAIRERGSGAELRLELPAPSDPLGHAPADSDAEFLLERYTAYTCRHGVRRYFRVSHEPWSLAPTDVPPPNLAMVERVFPWFAEAEYHSAHYSPGVPNVRMGCPHRLSPNG